MRPLVASLAAAALMASPALAARPTAPSAQAASPRPAASPAPRLVRLQAEVKRLGASRLGRAYAEAQLALARELDRVGRHQEAFAAAAQAGDAFDQQVELHKLLLEALAEPAQVRAERTRARELALLRDAANLLAGHAARRAGKSDPAIRRYVLVVQSQAEEPAGLEAYQALTALGFAAPAPAASPSASPSPASAAPSAR